MESSFSDNVTTSIDIVTTFEAFTDRTHDDILSQLPTAHVYYVPIMIIAVCVGILGNMLVIGAVVRDRKLRVLQNVFIVNLSVADLIVCMIVMPFTIVSVIDNGRLMLRLPVLCEFLATMCVTGCACSIWSIVSVSINRYIAICHRLTYPNIYNKRTVPLMVAGLWVLAFTVDMPIFLGWGEHIFDNRSNVCVYDYSHSIGYTIYVVILAFVAPLSTLCYSYLRIYKYARESSHQMRALADNRFAKQRYNGINSVDRRLLQTVALICVAFVVMWSLYSIVVIFDLGEYPWLFVTATFLGFLSSSVNFIIYATNDTFRDAYAEILRTIFCRKQRKQSDDRSLNVQTITMEGDQRVLR